MSNEALTNDAERYLTFSLGTESFAIPLLKVREVIALPEITPVPQTPTHFVGISNLRGQIITVLDLRSKLGIKPGSGSETVVIVCDLSPFSIGVIVDSVNSVIAVLPEKISESPDLNGKGDYITGIYQDQGHLTLLLDISKSLSLAEQNAIRKQQNQNLTEKKAA